MTFLFRGLSLLQPAFPDGYEHFLCCRATRLSLSLLRCVYKCFNPTPGRREGWIRAAKGGKKNKIKIRHWLSSFGALRLTTAARKRKSSRYKN